MFKRLPSRFRSAFFPAVALALAGIFSNTSYAQSGEGVCLTCTVPGTAGTQDATNSTHITLPTYVYTYVKPGETYSFSGQILNAGTYAAISNYNTDGWKLYTPNGQKTVNAGSAQSYTVGANEGGIWTLVVPQGGASQWRSYGVTIANGSTAIGGRTYTLLLPVHQDYSGTGNGLATFTLWYVNISGGIYKSTFNNYSGWDSNVYADAVGVADAGKAGYVPLRKSLPRASASGSAVGSPNVGIVTNANRATRFNSYDYNTYSANYYKQFFTQPDATLPASAPIWDLASNAGSNTWLRPAIQNPDVSNLNATVDGNSIIYTFNISNYNGTSATLQIDQDGNGTTDYTTTIPATTGANTYRFNTTGTGVTINASLKSTVLIDKSQEIHFVLDDVEGFGGLTLVRQNGGASGNTTSPTLYWDDTSSEMSTQNSNPPTRKDGTAGVNSDVTGGVRGWAYNGNANSSWGNNSYIDNWAFESVSEKESVGLLAISGKVFNDVDGIGNGINGQGTNAGGLFVLLVDNSTNTTLAETSVNADGTYTLLRSQGGAFTTVLSSQSVAVGTNLGSTYASSLPTGWVNTGENLGASTANDGTPNGILSLGNVTANVTNANFGIEQPPVAGSGTANGGTTPSGTNQATVPASTFTSTTPSSDPTAVTGIRITQFPTGATSIVVNGTTYTTANVAALTALVIPTDANGNPTVTITVDPTATTSTTVTIPFKAIDAAGKESANTGSAVITFTAALPVGLINFGAKVQSDQTVLTTWSTSWEFNNQAFIVERSKDLITFEEIGQIRDVAANEKGTTSYKFIDASPYRGTSYYRLRQVDRTGSGQTFSAVGVVIDARYSVYPNPVVQSSFTLELDEPATAQISLFTLAGSELPFIRADSTDSSVRIKSMSSLPKGIYLLKVTERGTTRTYRLVTQ